MVFLLNLLYSTRYTDLGPLRAIRKCSLDSLKMTDTTYGWTIEMQIKAALHGLRVTEIPVTVKPRIGVSKISGTLKGTVGACYKMLLLLLKYRLKKNHGVGRVKKAGTLKF